MFKKTTLEESLAKYQAQVDAIPKPIHLVNLDEVIKVITSKQAVTFDEMVALIQKLDIYELVEEKKVYRGTQLERNNIPERDWKQEMKKGPR